MSQIMNVQEIPITKILVDEDFNCRGTITAADVIDLAKDIKTRGLMQPVLVTPIPEDANGHTFRLLGGFRRLIAHQVNMMETIMANVRDGVSELEAISINLVENLNRQALNVSQEARALAHMRKLGVTRDMAARMLGMSPGWVQVRYMFLDLPEIVRKEIDSGNIGAASIRVLYTTYTKFGVAKCIEAVKVIKDAKLKGTSQQAALEKAKKRSVTNKSLRSKSEIELMLVDVLLPAFDECLATRTLAWAAGNITDGELFDACREDAKYYGKTFVNPW